MGKKKIGRKKGSRNKGFFFRAGRGWYAKDAENKNVPLLGPDGQHIKSRSADSETVKAAFDCWQTATEAKRKAATLAERSKSSPTVSSVCIHYLTALRTSGSKKSYYSRANTLYDFCYAYPAKFRRKKDEGDYTAEERRQMEKEKCNHPAYGQLPASDLTILHLNEWLAAHPTWRGSRRMRVQAVKRAMNYAVQAKLIPNNPVKDCPCGRTATRIAYLTEEQEAALLKHASPAFKIALQVCIRTGMRYGVEFTPITKEQVAFGLAFA